MKLFKAFFYFLLICTAQVSAQSDTVITGKLDNRFFQESWAVEWRMAAAAYQPDSAVIRKINTLLPATKIECRVILGTWCSDSRQHVPALIKISELTGIACEFWGVSRKKECPLNDCSGWDIEYVPTFEIWINDSKAGRIVESPTISVEANLLEIMGNTRK
jgi:hypothetical protein